MMGGRDDVTRQRSHHQTKRRRSVTFSSAAARLVFTGGEEEERDPGNGRRFRPAVQPCGRASLLERFVPTTTVTDKATSPPSRTSGHPDRGSCIAAIAFAGSWSTSSLPRSHPPLISTVQQTVLGPVACLCLFDHTRQAVKVKQRSMLLWLTAR